MRVVLVTGELHLDHVEILPPDNIVATGVNYIVDGVTPGRDVTIAALKEIKI